MPEISIRNEGQTPSLESASTLTPPSVPVNIITADQDEWFKPLFGDNPYLILARFRAIPDSRPTIYCRRITPSMNLPPMTVNRINICCNYIDELIHRYILHHEYYNKYDDFITRPDDDLFCVFDVRDRTGDIPLTVGYESQNKSITLIPDVHFWHTKGYFSERELYKKNYLPWDQRRRLVFWRGSSTGGILTTDSLQQLPRYRLCAAGAVGARLHGVLDAKITQVVQVKNADEEQEQRVRALIQRHGLLSARVPQTEFLKYRFLIDIDGNSNSWGFFTKLLTGSCIIKVMSAWQQWYYDQLKPWTHFVPVKNDLSDLEERITWCLHHDDEAQQIGMQGRKLANSMVFGIELPRAAEATVQACQSLDDIVSRVTQLTGIAKKQEVTKVSPSIGTQLTSSRSQSEDGTMYLMTAHRTFLGLDDKENLVQMDPSNTNLSKFIRIKSEESGYVVENNAMNDFKIEISDKGISFTKGNKYLCALPNLSSLIVDRDRRGAWEIFSPVLGE